MNYEEYFEMKHTPFRRDIPCESLYVSPAMEEAYARLRYAVDRQMFVVLTADAGCGKSTMMRKLNSALPCEEYLLLYLSDSKLTPKWLYKTLLDQLGLEAGFYRGDAKALLQKQIRIVREKEHRKVVCILDEAHLLEKETLEEFRFLLNSNFDSESQMALILVGQTELWSEKLRYKRYAAICQRIDIICRLPHLDRAETEAYIRAHMKYSGCTQELFTDAAYDEIYKSTNGIMRLINKVCDKSLTLASVQNKRLIDDHLVMAIEEHEVLGLQGE